jgi:hypothetical protein
MSPVEAVGRAVCIHMATHPDTWKGLEDGIHVGLDAFVATMPAPLRWAVRLWLVLTLKELAP